MIVSVRLKGKVHTVGVRALTVARVSPDDVFVEGRDHAGAVVFAAHLEPSDARRLARRLLRALRSGAR